MSGSSTNNSNSLQLLPSQYSERQTATSFSSSNNNGALSLSRTNLQVYQPYYRTQLRSSNSFNSNSSIAQSSLQARIESVEPLRPQHASTAAAAGVNALPLRHSTVKEVTDDLLSDQSEHHYQEGGEEEEGVDSEPNLKSVVQRQQSHPSTSTEINEILDNFELDLSVGLIASALGKFSQLVSLNLAELYPHRLIRCIRLLQFTAADSIDRLESKQQSPAPIIAKILVQCDSLTSTAFYDTNDSNAFLPADLHVFTCNLLGQLHAHHAPVKSAKYLQLALKAAQNVHQLQHQLAITYFHLSQQQSRSTSSSSSNYIKEELDLLNLSQSYLHSGSINIISNAEDSDIIDRQHAYIARINAMSLLRIAICYEKASMLERALEAFENCLAAAEDSLINANSQSESSSSQQSYNNEPNRMLLARIRSEFKDFTQRYALHKVHHTNLALAANNKTTIAGTAVGGPSMKPLIRHRHSKKHHENKQQHNQDPVGKPYMQTLAASPARQRTPSHLKQSLKRLPSKPSFALSNSQSYTMLQRLSSRDATATDLSSMTSFQKNAQHRSLLHRPVSALTSLHQEQMQQHENHPLLQQQSQQQQNTLSVLSSQFFSRNVSLSQNPSITSLPSSDSFNYLKHYQKNPMNSGSISSSDLTSPSVPLNSGMHFLSKHTSLPVSPMIHSTATATPFGSSNESLQQHQQLFLSIPTQPQQQNNATVSAAAAATSSSTTRMDLLHSLKQQYNKTQANMHEIEMKIQHELAKGGINAPAQPRQQVRVITRHRNSQPTGLGSSTAVGDTKRSLKYIRKHTSNSTSNPAASGAATNTSSSNSSLQQLSTKPQQFAVFNKQQIHSLASLSSKPSLVLTTPRGQGSISSSNSPPRVERDPFEILLKLESTRLRVYTHHTSQQQELQTTQKTQSSMTSLSSKEINTQLSQQQKISQQQSQQQQQQQQQQPHQYQTGSMLFLLNDSSKILQIQFNSRTGNEVESYIHRVNISDILYQSSRMKSNNSSDNDTRVRLLGAFCREISKHLFVNTKNKCLTIDFASSLQQQQQWKPQWFTIKLKERDVDIVLKTTADSILLLTESNTFPNQQSSDYIALPEYPLIARVDTLQEVEDDQDPQKKQDDDEDDDDEITPVTVSGSLRYLHVPAIGEMKNNREEPTCLPLKQSDKQSQLHHQQQQLQQQQQQQRFQISLRRDIIDEVIEEPDTFTQQLNKESNRDFEVETEIFEDLVVEEKAEVEEQSPNKKDGQLNTATIVVEPEPEPAQDAPVYQSKFGFTSSDFLRRRRTTPSQLTLLQLPEKQINGGVNAANNVAEEISLSPVPVDRNSRSRSSIAGLQKIENEFNIVIEGDKIGDADSNKNGQEAHEKDTQKQRFQFDQGVAAAATPRQGTLEDSMNDDSLHSIVANTLEQTKQLDESPPKKLQVAATPPRIIISKQVDEEEDGCGDGSQTSAKTPAYEDRSRMIGNAFDSLGVDPYSGYTIVVEASKSTKQMQMLEAEEEFQKLLLERDPEQLNFAAAFIQRRYRRKKHRDEFDFETSESHQQELESKHGSNDVREQQLPQQQELRSGKMATIAELMSSVEGDRHGTREDEMSSSSYQHEGDQKKQSEEIQLDGDVNEYTAIANRIGIVVEGDEENKQKTQSEEKDSSGNQDDKTKATSEHDDKDEKMQDAPNGLESTEKELQPSSELQQQSQQIAGVPAEKNVNSLMSKATQQQQQQQQQKKKKAARVHGEFKLNKRTNQQVGFII